MIEKYFQLGVRYGWQKPQNMDGPRDGAIVASIRPTAQLTYIALGPIQHQWLDYAPGRTARVPIGPYDVLTGFMSGCIIARWTAGGVNYVGHVGTVESDPAVNRTVKHAFAFAMPPGTTGFNPLQAWADEGGELSRRFRPPKVPQICALVTTGGEFYSVVMFIDGANEWYCGGTKKVQPIIHDNLKMRCFGSIDPRPCHCTM